MAQFLPFRGLRYDTKQVNLSQVLCPPYDVIKGAARDELLARDPHNIVAIELAARYGENATPEQYDHCAKLLKEWREAGLLTRDDSAFYIYEQEFEVPGSPGEVRRRRGVIGQLTLEEFGKGVQPHEHTLSGPKQDRLNLLRTLHTNTSPIFGLVADDEGWIDSVLETGAMEKPVAEATDSDGIVHRLWRLRDDESVNAIEAAFEAESILIADGHHRYETALNFRNEQMARAEAEGREWTGGEGANAVMMMCVSTQDSGLIVLPTHRVVKNVSEAQLASLPERLAQHFEVETVSDDEAVGISGEGGQPQLGLHLKGQSYRLTLKPGGGHMPSMEQDKSAAYNGLDVTILHRLILENELGVGPAELAAGQHVIYTIDADEAIRKVEAGEAGAAFLLRPTPVSQVQAVAAAGDKMPQKSTYFYPKLITGLVLRPLD
jgi:uncharacterized protein (DUF1015 family)